MQFYITILAIVMMMVEVSLAGSLGRVKRDDNDPLLVYRKCKAVIEEAEPIIEAVVQDMPRSVAYSKYKHELENFLQKLNQKTGELCIRRIFITGGELVDLLKPYDDMGAPAEAIAVFRLFFLHGYKEFRDKHQAAFETVDMPTFIANLNSLSDADIAKNKEFAELC